VLLRLDSDASSLTDQILFRQLRMFVDCILLLVHSFCNLSKSGPVSVPSQAQARGIS
jgi:hypothetical protein